MKNEIKIMNFLLCDNAFLDNSKIGFLEQKTEKIPYSECFKGFLFVGILFKRRI